MSVGLVLQLFVVIIIIAQCQCKTFVLGGVTTADIPQLTTALEVDGEHRNPCYVSVVVYDTPDRIKAYKGATVTVLTRSITDSSKYYGYAIATTNEYGQACLLTLCRKEALIYVEAGSTNERLFAVKQANQALPTGYTYQSLQDDQNVVFTVRNWGVVFNKSGPVFYLEEKSSCENARTEHNHFSFSFIAIKEELTGADYINHMNNMAWYYPYPGTDPFQTPLYQAKVTLESIDPVSKLVFGTFTAGPKASPSSTKPTEKAACMEFRCAATDNTFGVEFVMNTTVIGWVSGSSLQRCEIKGNARLNDVRTNTTYFETTIRANDNYGANFGIYKHPDKETAKSMCYTGEDHLIPGYSINPDTNYFVSFDCISKPETLG